MQKQQMQKKFAFKIKLQSAGALSLCICAYVCVWACVRCNAIYCSILFGARSIGSAEAHVQFVTHTFFFWALPVLFLLFISIITTTSNYSQLLLPLLLPLLLLLLLLLRPDAFINSNPFAHLIYAAHKYSNKWSSRRHFEAITASWPQIHTQAHTHTCIHTC